MHKDADEDEFFDPELAWEREEEARRKAADAEAESNSTFDYFERYRSYQPKREIGEYVAERGFKVPLIGNLEEWQQAVDDGTAMIRSEMSQDYDGFSGLLSSAVLTKEHRRLLPLGEISDDLRVQMEELVLDGLRNGDLSPAEYMRLFEWPANRDFIDGDANSIGVPSPLDSFPTASEWQYVSGTNLRVFRDPVVDGRYHMGTKPRSGYEMGWQVDQKQHGESLSYERMEREIPLRQVIEFYEEIRALPRFDNEQAPLIEAQFDNEGELHFLQYLKTGQRLRPTEAFEIPTPGGAVRARNVRGATAPEGKELRIYLAPDKITKHMRDQGFFFDIFRPNPFAQQCMSMVGSVVIHEAYVSLKGNHFETSPMYRPEVAMGLIGCEGVENARKLRELMVLAHGRHINDRPQRGHAYIDAKITSNGREAAIESDWEPHFEEDSSLESG